MKISRDEESLLSRGGRPTLADLLDKMTFSPSRGAIDINGARMVLARATFGADLQDELVRRFGAHEAMVILLRLGYRNGREDAEFIRRAWPNLDVGDAFTAGTRLHMVSGTVRVETLHNDFDFKSDRFSGDFLWHDSVEAGEYARRHGRATKPVCWAQTGYAAGYASVFFRKLILYKEVSCAAMGAKSCRVVGKTVDDWGKDDPFVRMFLDEVLVTRAETPAREKADTAFPLSELIVAPVQSDLERIASARLPALITGQIGTGRFEAAAWLHRRRFPNGALHRLHATSPDLLPRLASLRQPTKDTPASGQTLVIEDVETLSDAAQVDLINLLSRSGPQAERLQVVGLSRQSAPEQRADNRLRTDLLHALAVLPVLMPPLAERKAGLAAIADALLARTFPISSEPRAKLEDGALAQLRAYDWHGNFPELQGVLTRARLTAETATIQAKDIAQAHHPAPALHDAGGGPDAVTRGVESLWPRFAALLDAGHSFDQLQAGLERKALEAAEGNVSAAARRLGTTRAQLDYRLKARPRP